MSISFLTRFLFASIAIILLPASQSYAEEVAAPVKLTEFKSNAGRFSIHLPGEPKHETTTVGDAEEIQHQFTTPTEQGVFLVSYQDNPNLEGKAPNEMESALESGRDRLKVAFQGELIENNSVKLNGIHPGLDFRLTIPAAGGEARCRFYLVGTRLYQILVIGVPDFVNSNPVREVIESFKVLP